MRDKSSTGIQRITNSILLLICISICVPFSPKMPAPGLDPSWALGLNQAVAQGLAFGRDIIFTLGPYAALYTKAYHPALDNLIMATSLYLALCYWAGLSLLLNNKSWIWACSFCIMLYVMLYSRDALFFSYPLLIGLLCAQTTRQKSSSHVLLVFLFTPLGLLSLIKSSFLTLSIAVGAACFLFFLTQKEKALAFAAIAAPAVACVFFWLIIGQKPSGIAEYVLNTLTMVSGFTEAMSVQGNNKEIIFYAVNALMILLTLAFHEKNAWAEKLFLLSLYGFFLLIAFKTGFARHYGHALIPGTAILLAALFLPLVLPAKRTWIIVLCALTTWYYINSHYTAISLYKNLLSTSSATWHGLSTRIINKDWLKQDFALSMAFLKQRYNFPTFPGRTDIYSYNQAYLIASDNHWAPRPVFQSYSVFNQKLAEKNKVYLQSLQRPDTIIFKIEPIDTHLPALEDGASWPLLINLYQPFRLEDDFLFLHKRQQSTNPNTLVHPLIQQKCRLGEYIKIPKTTQPVFVTITLKQTLLGYLSTLLYKSAPLEVTVYLTKGQQKTFRLPANMAQAGFLISPLIETTTEFTLLYGNLKALDSKSVRALTIHSSSGSWQWQHKYQISFARMHIPNAGPHNKKAYI